MGLKQFLLDKKKWFATSLVALSGCAMHFDNANESVDFSMAAVPGVGSGGFVHTIYETPAREDIESRLESRISGALFNGQLEMKIYGEDNSYIGKYLVQGNLGNIETYFYDAEDNLMKQKEGFPEYWPTLIQFTSPGWITYSNESGNYFNYHSIDDRFERMVREYHDSLERSCEENQ